MEGIAPVRPLSVRRAALEAVLTVLVHACEIEADEEDISRAASRVGGESPEDHLADACDVLGLRIRPLYAAAREALPHARRDLPIVAWLDDGHDWLVCDRHRLGRVRIWRWSDPRGTRWVSLGELDSVEPRLWGFVEPSLPAGALAASEAGGTPPSPLRRLGRLLKVEREDLVVVALYAVVISVLSLATPIAVQVLINFLAFGALLQPVLVLAVGLLLCLTLVGLFHALQRWTVEIIQRRIFVRVVTDLSERLLRARVDAFDRNYGPELVNRFFDVFTVQKAVGTLVLDGFTAGLQAAVGLTLLALYHPVLLAFDAVILVGMGVIFFLGRGAQSTAIEQSKIKYKVAGWLEEIARHPVVFKLGGANLAADRTDQLARSYLRARDRHFRIFFRQYVGVQVVQVVVNVTLLALCGWLVLEGELTLGQLVAAEFIVAAALSGLAKFSEKLDTIYGLLAGVDKLGALVDLPQEPRTGAPLGSPSTPAAVELEGACYRYPDGRDGIGPLDLEVQPGERVVITGSPASGKSTLADLIAGIRHPTDGAVLRDGMDLTALRPARAHAEVEIVRTGGIIQATLLENLTLGLDIPEAEVWAVLERLGMRSTVMRLPDKLETELHPNGLPLSEGRARSLLVARAILARPRLLVVDGLLDAVPRVFRRRLYAALTDPDAPWTLLVLSEDEAVTRGFDRTLHLVNGELVERSRLRSL